MATRLAHNQKIDGSIPSSAPIGSIYCDHRAVSASSYEQIQRVRLLLMKVDKFKHLIKCTKSYSALNWVK